MLVSAAQMLKDAKAGKYAVGQFNINNLEWTKAILLTAQDKTPLIIEIPDRHGTGRKPDFITGYVNEAIGLKL